MRHADNGKYAQTIHAHRRGVFVFGISKPWIYSHCCHLNQLLSTVSFCQDSVFTAFRHSQAIFLDNRNIHQ